MFFLLSKIFQFVFSPLTWILVLFTISFIIRKEQKTAKHLRVIAFSLLLLFSNPFIFYECMRAWEPEAKQKSEIKEYYDYGIVLTGMMTYDEKYDRINFNSSNDRLLQAVELYRENRIGKIFITGGSGEIFNQSAKESEILKDYLVVLGIPSEDIEIETVSRNTYENAVESAKILKPDRNSQTYLLITSAFHMRRAEGCFKKQGFIFDTYVTERYAGKRVFTPDIFLPKSEIFQSWALLIHEIGGYIVYDITGKL
ncbi:MAG TPA: YdcF family protein [Bacteroidales bacterium]|nr:YdcF family protein [Bacteroidales bacterium]